MAGDDDEARARALLEDMRLRISQGPSFALGLGDAYGPQEVRAAFLAMTKQFHPARFGRMSNDVRSLANEVFIGIKAAHEVLLRTLGASIKPVGSRRATGGMQPLSADGTARTPIIRSAVPAARSPVTGTTPPATQHLARGTDRASSPSIPNQTGGFPREAPTPAQEPTPPAGSYTRPSESGRLPRQPSTSPTATPTSAPHVTPPAGMPRTTPPAGMPRPTPPAGIPRTTPPAGGVPRVDLNPPTQRGAATPAGTTQPLPRASVPPAQNFDVATQRGVGTFDEHASYREALRYIQQQNWTAARTTLHTLAGRVPQNAQYRALLCYTRGREAHVAGRGEEALLEYQRALQLVPDLEVVKQAVGELQRRR